MKLYFGGIADDESLRLIVRAESNGMVGDAETFVQPNQIAFGKTYDQLLDILYQQCFIEISDGKSAIP